MVVQNIKYFVEEILYGRQKTLEAGKNQGEGGTREEEEGPSTAKKTKFSESSWSRNINKNGFIQVVENDNEFTAQVDLRLTVSMVCSAFHVHKQSILTEIYSSVI